MRHRAATVLAIAVVGIMAVGAYIHATTGSDAVHQTPVTPIPPGSRVQVVAAENFWGSLISQLGGTQADVTSIVTDPNTDPHEYEANAANAKAMANANLVIVNGANYDTWAQTLVNANNAPNRQVLVVQNVLGLAGSSDLNPHFWYSPFYVNKTVGAMYKALVAIDPTDVSYFRQQYAALNSSLYHSYMSMELQIRKQSAGVPVAATEDIFVYMANATGLKLVSPPSFMQAVAEGNDPSPQDVAAFQRLMQGGNISVHVLVYNQQTVTPITENIKSLAAQNRIPSVPITETIQPPGVTFQTWMGAELASLQKVLNAQSQDR